MCAAHWTTRLRTGLPAHVDALTRPGAAPDRPAPPVGAPTQPPTARALTAAGPVRAEWTSRRAAPAHLAHGELSSPFGTIQVAATAEGVCGVSLYLRPGAFRAHWPSASWDDPTAQEHAATAGRQLAEFFRRERAGFDVPLDLYGLTEFDARVLAAIAAIPCGSTLTYGELARAIGSPGAARAVGRACGRNPVPLLIPCHRVLRASDGLGGYAEGGPSMKAALLGFERGSALP